MVGGKKQQIHDTGTKKHKQCEGFTQRLLPGQTLPFPSKAKHVPRYEDRGQGASGSAEDLIFYFLPSLPFSPQSYMSECLPWKERIDHRTFQIQGPNSYLYLSTMASSSNLVVKGIDSSVNTLASNSGSVFQQPTHIGGDCLTREPLNFSLGYGINYSIILHFVVLLNTLYRYMCVYIYI